MDQSSTPVTSALGRVKVRVPAKVNLALKVGALGDDGYHPLGTVFHALSLYDDVEARLAEGLSCEMRGDSADTLPVDGSNLVMRAAALLRETYDCPQGAEVSVLKTIPVAGGMAGGSADAAATLLACAMLWDLDTQPEDLHDLAAQLGSDVPFALVGGTARGAGRGTELVPMLSRGTYHWVLALADEGLSTPGVYRRFDEMVAAGEITPSIEIPPALLNALAAGDVAGVGRELVNDLQAPAVSLRPELGDVLDTGRAAGALGTVLSGSGPTCAFLVGSEEAAMDLATELSHHRSVWATRRAVGPVPGARPVS
ncbi:4-(cytidine 5'-diphospho)-2-C-methyl-D-erythritol kinase [Propionibacteriaceae bacterium G1746]